MDENLQSVHGGLTTYVGHCFLGPVEAYSVLKRTFTRIGHTDVETMLLGARHCNQLEWYF